MIRGRLCDDTKPETFNQLWTVEEQVIDISKLCRLKKKVKIRLWIKYILYIIPPGPGMCGKQLVGVSLLHQCVSLSFPFSFLLSL